MCVKRNKWFQAFLIILVCFFCSPANGARIKDLASIKGVRINQLVGYGLVVGLNGTGDGSGTKFTVQSLVNMMERLGIHTIPNDVKVSNVAAVMVTANLPPFAKVGTKLDVLVSSIGDAKSLLGGTLLITPLKGADNKVYAVAQGPLVVGGFSASGNAGGGVQKNHPTVARIPDGATVEREIPFRFRNMDKIVISLSHPDFTTALRISQTINSTMGSPIASALDPGTIDIKVPDSFKNNLVELVAALEQLQIEPDRKAKIILDERTGTVVMGENVRISAVAIAHGNLSVQIKERQDVSQPTAFSNGRTVVTNDTQINIKEEGNKLILMPKGTSLGELVRALNAIGVTPRDLISVFQAIKAAGALEADLEII